MKYQLSILLLSAVSVIYISFPSYADISYAESDRRAALQSCAQEAGIPLPTSEAEHPTLTSEQKGQLRLCMANKGYRKPSNAESRSRAAIEKCLAQSGVTLPAQPAEWESLDSNTQEAIMACRSQI